MAHTQDIVEQLRDRAYSSKFTDTLLAHAADEIERLRKRALSGCETVQSGYTESRRGPRHVTETYVKNDENATDSSTNREPVARHPQTALTDSEREAVERVSVAYELLPTEGAKQVAATLRGLLDRLA